jgi:general secretion pathway protein M
MRERLRKLWSDAQAWFAHLTERERILVSTAAGAVALFTVFVVLLSFSTSAARTRARTERKMRQLAEASALAASYADAERARKDTERQLTGSTMSLPSYIEEKGERAGIKIPTMNPKGEVAIGDGRILESTVELTLTDVSIRNLHAFLTQVEQGQPGVVKVKYLRIEPRAENQTLTAWATVASYRLKQ